MIAVSGDDAWWEAYGFVDHGGWYEHPVSHVGHSVATGLTIVSEGCVDIRAYPETKAQLLQLVRLFTPR